MARGHDKYVFTVDGASHGTSDKVLTGAQIREVAGQVPASDFVLIELVDGFGRSIGLEDEVQFVDGKTTVFRSFASDRIYTFVVDERGWEWGAATISAGDIYRYGQIDEDRELILASDSDRLIPPEGELELGGTSVERVLSREARTVTIKVNGRPRTVEKRRHSYREIAALAYPNPDFDHFNYTTTYLHGVDGAEGDLVEGETIMVRNGMVFNVRRSDKS